MADEKPMVTDDERAYADAVHKATNGEGVYPKGHPNAGLTRQEAIDRANEARQNPPPLEGKQTPVTAPIETSVTSKKNKDAAAKEG